MKNEYDTLQNTLPPDSAYDPKQEFEALQAVIAALQPLAGDVRARIYESAGTFLKIGVTLRASRQYDQSATASTGAFRQASPGFSDDRAMLPKEFLLEKQPRTDVERVACLAFYLTHYRDTPHFKTLDLSKLNTEAAQPKFANAATATSNAVKRGYLVPATKGQRQLSAAGEQFVQALPDRDAAKLAMSTARPKRRSRRASSSGSKLTEKSA